MHLPPVRVGVRIAALAAILSFVALAQSGDEATPPAEAAIEVTPPAAIEVTPGGSLASAPPAPRPTLEARFDSTIRPIGHETRARMGTSWRPGCPVPLADLRSIVLTHWGFDGAVKQGELIVHRTYARAVAGVFEELFDARFPIERMEPSNGYMGNDPPLAQFNNTVGFNCRAPVGGGRRWSEHSYGSAIDINPDQNPYVSRTGRVEPLFGKPWIDRSLRDPAMIHADSVAVRAFREIGWRWGGFWSSTKDYMHFSASGR